MKPRRISTITGTGNFSINFQDLSRQVGATQDRSSCSTILLIVAVKDIVDDGVSQLLIDVRRNEAYTKDARWKCAGSLSASLRRRHITWKA